MKLNLINSYRAERFNSLVYLILTVVMLIFSNSLTVEITTIIKAIFCLLFFFAYRIIDDYYDIEIDREKGKQRLMVVEKNINVLLYTSFIIIVFLTAIYYPLVCSNFSKTVYFGLFQLAFLLCYKFLYSKIHYYKTGNFLVTLTKKAFPLVKYPILVFFISTNFVNIYYYLSIFLLFVFYELSDDDDLLSFKESNYVASLLIFISSLVILKSFLFAGAFAGLKCLIFNPKHNLLISKIIFLLIPVLYFAGFSFYF